jgi:nucleoside-diphosphate-sugar epimerase
MQDKVLVIGACGQVGTELVENLQRMHGADNVVASDIRESSSEVFKASPFELLDVLDKKRIAEVFKQHKPKIVYHLAALLSATAEAKPKLDGN